MPSFDLHSVLEEVKEEALLPHPVKLRDMILRTKLDPQAALDINRDFQNYLSHFGDAQKLAANILQSLVAHEPKSA